MTDKQTFILEITKIVLPFMAGWHVANRRRGFKSRGIKMGFQKIIPLGNYGQIEIDESGAEAKVIVSLLASVGGGSVAGVVKAKASIELDVNALQVINAGLELAKEKFPAASAIIGVLEAAIDAELKKV